MIPAVAHVDSGFTAAGPECFDWSRSEEPVGDVEDMYVLLDDYVAGKRDVEDPVTQAGTVTAIRGICLGLQPARLVVDLARDDLAQRAPVNLPGRLLEERIHARLEV